MVLFFFATHSDEDPKNSELKELLIKLEKEIEEIRKMLSDEAPDQMLTTKEAAEFLHYAPDSIYSMISRDEIPSHYHRGRRYFSRNELIEWRKSN